MMIGVELVRDRETKDPFPRTDQVTERVLAAAREAGLLLYASTGHVDGTNGDLVMLGPPFVITDEDARGARGADRGRDPLGAVSDRVGLVLCPEARIYDHGPQHPLRPQRVLLTWDLIHATGLDELPERRAAPELRAGRRRHDRARAHRGVRGRDTSRGPRRGRRLVALRLRARRQPHLRSDARGGCARGRRQRDGGACRLVGRRATTRSTRPGDSITRCRNARRGSASTTTPRWRSRGCCSRARNGSPTSTSTCTTVTACSSSSTTTRGC